MKERKKQKKYIVLILLLLIIGGITGYKLFKTQPKEIVAGSFLPEGKDAKAMSKEELKNASQKEVDESVFTLSIYPDATFENGEAEGDIFIRNEVENAYPIAVEIVNDENGEIIYESGAIQPGEEVLKGKLKKKLDKGNYKCTANVSIYDAKTQKYRGQTNAEVNVEVLN